jgi:hypothetical protein
MRKPLVIYDFATAPLWIYIWGKFDFLFYQCNILWSSKKNLFSFELSRPWPRPSGNPSVKILPWDQGSSQLQPVPASSSQFQPAPDGGCSWCYSINNHFTEFLWRNETYHFSKYNFSFKGHFLFSLLLTKISPAPAGSSWLQPVPAGSSRFQPVPVGGCSWCYSIKKLVTEFL